MSYLLLLTENILYIGQSCYGIPDSLTKYVSQIQSFPSKEKAEQYLANQLTFDDIYQFKAEYGIKERQVYTK